MNPNDTWQSEGRDGPESGPIAIGEIMPAVLARYGLTQERRWEDAGPGAELAAGVELAPAVCVLAEA